MGATHQLNLTPFDLLDVRKGNEQLAEKLELNDVDEVGILGLGSSERLLKQQEALSSKEVDHVFKPGRSCV